jgi:hypothetical protein
MVRRGVLAARAGVMGARRKLIEIEKDGAEWSK